MLCLTIGLLILLPSAFAADTVFQGGGLASGRDQAGTISGVSDREIREVATGILEKVIEFLGLIAALAFVVSGIMFMLSFGNEQTHTKAKNTAIYAIIGLLVILFAQGIISFVSNLG